MNSQGAVGGNLDRRLDVIVGHDRQLGRGDSRLVEEDLLGIDQSRTRQIDLYFGTTLTSHRTDCRH